MFGRHSAFPAVDSGWPFPVRFVKAATMAKPKKRYVCQACGSVAARWQGQCTDCAEWNSLVEDAAGVVTPFAAKHDLRGGGRRIELVGLDAKVPLPARTSTGIGELDRALGGGLVAGSATLIGGDPGIGKSTLLLQAAAKVARQGVGVAYISGEEAADQVRLRARRLGLGDAPLQLAAATSVRDILTTVGDGPTPGLIVIDSIQTMYSDLIEGAPGTVSQVRASAHELIRFAKDSGAALVLVGHVTKDGSVAGPRVLEHLVDVVLQFEGERASTLRLLRGVKNRFGPSDEVGCFELRDDGIAGIADPSGLFLTPRETAVPGTAVTVVVEGKRALLAEVQALVAASSLAQPRRAVSGLDAPRVAMILAVAERRAGIALAGSDVFTATVGGMRVPEPAADLAVALAVASAVHDLPLPAQTVAIGEIGLAGELRRVSGLGRRLAEAARLGFTRALIPPECTDRVPDGMRVTEVTDLAAALRALRVR